MNDETINRIIAFVVGMAVGYVAHIIVTILRETKKEVDELLEIERSRDERGILQYRLAFNIVFGFMILFVLVSASLSIKNTYDLKENQRQDFINLCHSGQNIREVQRSTVDEVYSLATSFIDPDVPRTPQEVFETNRYIDRANLFRTSSYSDIQPVNACKPFVTDTGRVPRTPPFPHVK